ncbi:MAG: threonine synthase [Coriobacteriales bacterium]|jgi:threonine synthase|nr:threonine synthase [Coriobacteriales bacterium]
MDTQTLTSTNYTNTYLDTRGVVAPGSGPTFTEAIVKGIAPGGGLFVPQILPRLTLDELAALAPLSYPELASYIYKRFGVDMPSGTVDELMGKAYNTNFDHEAVAPVRTLEPNTHVLELWHGPTSAFKDMALQCLPVFFSAAVDQLRAQKNPQAQEDFLILVATSGDTGKAALEGFANREHTNIIVFYPDGGVSDIQLKQMVTQLGDNVGVFGVRGNFDDCQTAVKGVFANEDFNAKLASTHHLRLSSANSINWGRLLPQVVYYVSAYLQLVKRGELLCGNPLDICVPTGNFGNILAAWYAKELGVPIEMLFCASNDNRVLTDFINTGTYDITDRPFILTPSPSMDILVSSNLERQLFELTGRNSEAICTYMNKLRDERRFTIDRETFAALRAQFSADWVSANESLTTIREVFEAHNYLIDPHTAVSWKVAERLRGQNPVLVVSTAHWAKFGTDVYRALAGIEVGAELPAELADLTGAALNEFVAENWNVGKTVGRAGGRAAGEAGSRASGKAADKATDKTAGAAAIPSRLASLDTAPVRFTEVIDGSAQAVEQAVLDWLES